MAFKKIDKEFQVTDSTVNVYGFRLLTSGYLMEEFQKNPIGFYMHGEYEQSPREQGVLVRWEDFRIDGDKVFAKPVINLAHPRGEQTVEEINDGFLNGASVGKIVALEISDDPAFMLPGQTGPTVTRWYNRELSLVDIPGNFNSLTLFDSDGNAINLADFKIQKTDMKQLFLTPEMISKLGLADNADQAQAITALQNLADKASKYDQAKQDLEQAQAATQVAQTALADYKKEQAGKEVASLLDVALNDKKITVAQKNVLATQYEGKPDELKALLDATPAYQPITSQLSDEQKGTEEKFKNLSYSQLDKAGLLPSLKAANLDLFKQKFQDEYGVEYKG